MKKYDVEKIKRLVEEKRESIKRASVGMYEDWFWTAETVFEEGEWQVELVEGKEIAGIKGSRWATPSLLIEHMDGSEESIACYKGESTEYQPPLSNLGVLSGPVQDRMPPLTFK